MFTLTPTPAPQRRTPTVEQTATNPWLLWRPETSPQPETLTVAELAECHCPDLCDRDHDNE